MHKIIAFVTALLLLSCLGVFAGGGGERMPELSPETKAWLEESLEHGTWFDGSSIEGFTRIAESDQWLQPDMNTFAEIPWQDFFIDNELRSVIELALSSNRDLRIAALNAAADRLEEIVGAILRPARQHTLQAAGPIVEDAVLAILRDQR